MRDELRHIDPNFHPATHTPHGAGPLPARDLLTVPPPPRLCAAGAFKHHAYWRR